MEHPCVKIHVLHGGILPERKSKGAIGYDVCIRAIVSPYEMDPVNQKLRKTLFDFRTMPEDPVIASHVVIRFREDSKNEEYMYQMTAGESVLVGLGFTTEMLFPMFYWMAPRSGLASKYGITVTNAPGTVDPDYRGEAGVLVLNRNTTTFDLYHGMRIAQIIFQWAIIPEFVRVEKSDDLIETSRGAGGFGSTGLS